MIEVKRFELVNWMMYPNLFSFSDLIVFYSLLSIVKLIIYNEYVFKCYGYELFFHKTDRVCHVYCNF